MSFEKFAMQEFRAAGWMKEDGTCEDLLQQTVCDNLLELLKVFASQGHSGFSAPYVINAFNKLASMTPLTPITGEDHEWTQVSEGVWQNRRLSSVFKDVDRFNGQAYDIEAVIFWEMVTPRDGGEPFKSYFTNYESAWPITFPYTKTQTYKEAKK